MEIFKCLPHLQDYDSSIYCLLVCCVDRYKILINKEKQCEQVLTCKCSDYGSTHIVAEGEHRALQVK